MKEENIPELSMRTFHVKSLYKKILLIIFILFCVVYFYQSKLFCISYNTPWSKSNDGKYTRWLVYDNNVPATFDWYRSNCFSDNIRLNIHSLVDNMKNVRTSRHEFCRKLLTFYTTCYDVEVRKAKLSLPPQFRKKVFRWLGNRKDLMNEVVSQKILHIKNKFTFEYTAFNPLRAKRPFVKPDVDPKVYALKIVEETKKSCDFCRFEILTSEDNLGRIVTNLTATSSNTFKYDSYHQLIFPRFQHNPLLLSKDEIVDLFMTTYLWFVKVNDVDKRYKYPLIVWDTFPHAGASQVHPHLQASINTNGYYGMFELLRSSAQKYHDDADAYKNYFTDLKDLHSAIGLAVKHGSATAIAHINAHKDYEVILLSEAVNHDIFELLYYVIKALNDDLQLLCFSMGAVYPEMNADDTTKGLMPVFIRILSRGVISTMNADISSLELFTLYNVNADPYKVIEAVKKSIEKRSIT